MKFSNWTPWTDRNLLRNIGYPGIYAIARSRKNIEGQPFDWQKEIIYFGMSNARGGLKSRMQQFQNTINGKRGHGGAQRVMFKHADHDDLVSKLFVAVSPTKCTVESNLPDDLRIMGDIARKEYRCLAEYVDRHGRLPEFNDKLRSPKK